ncbi:MAG: four helix bundle protein [Chryseolinea sp.]
MAKSIVRIKSFEFAVLIVKLCRSLVIEKREFVISNQLTRCGTSIGANIIEALNSHSQREFLYKLSISQRECDETLYWLEVLHSAELISQENFTPLHQRATELLKIIRSIIITTKAKADRDSQS